MNGYDYFKHDNGGIGGRAQLVDEVVHGVFKEAEDELVVVAKGKE